MMWIYQSSYDLQLSSKVYQPSSIMKLVLLVIFVSCCSALYVEPHLKPHHKSHHQDEDCTSTPSTECWDVEKPHVEHKTETKYDTVCNTVSARSCSQVFDKDCQTVTDRECKTEVDQ